MLGAVSTNMAFMIDAYGFTDPSNKTFLGGVLVLFGVVSLLIITKFVYKYKWYRKHLIYSSLLAIVTMVSLIPALGTGNVYICAISIAGLGIATFPAMPVTVELAI